MRTDRAEEMGILQTVVARSLGVVGVGVIAASAFIACSPDSGSGVASAARPNIVLFVAEAEFPSAASEKSRLPASIHHPRFWRT